MDLKMNHLLCIRSVGHHRPGRRWFLRLAAHDSIAAYTNQFSKMPNKTQSSPKYTRSKRTKDDEKKKQNILFKSNTSSNILKKSNLFRSLNHFCVPKTSSFQHWITQNGEKIHVKSSVLSDTVFCWIVTAIWTLKWNELLYILTLVTLKAFCLTEWFYNKEGIWPHCRITPTH